MGALGGATFAAGVTAFAVYVGRFFHGFALRATVLLSVAYGAAAVGMLTFLVICHLVLPFLFGDLFAKDAAPGRRPSPEAIVCESNLAGHPVIRGNTKENYL
jgi:hypothetical protein